MQEVRPGIYRLEVPIPDNPLGYLNAYLVAGDKGWLLIDTGWNAGEAFESLGRQLRDVGVAFEDISRIVVTHLHPDHYGLAGRIKRVSPARLALHRLESRAIRSRYIEFPRLQEEMRRLLHRYGAPPLELPSLSQASQAVVGFVDVVFPEEELEGGEEIDTGRFRLKTLWTPGHAAGHICLYEPERKLLFSGDHILPVITPNISYHLQSGPDPLGEYLRSLEELKGLEVELVLPAHEQVFSGLARRIEEIKEHHEQRARAILEVIAREARNAYDISAQIPWDIPGVTWETMSALDRRIAMTETLAHLEYLRLRGGVETVERNGIILYRART